MHEISSFLFSLAAVSAFAAPRPNIVLILADDMGYGDAQGLNRKSKIPTPESNDRIGSEREIATELEAELFKILANDASR